MSITKHLVDLGAPIADLKNSPIFIDIADERELVDIEIPEERVCYFNGESYPQGTYIKSGGSILQCDRGTWIETETEDEF